MSKPDDGPGGGTREGFLEDILDKVKDLVTYEDPPIDPAHPNHPDNRPIPEAEMPASGPIGHHDSERLSPPPVGGSVD